MLRKLIFGALCLLVVVSCKEEPLTFTISPSIRIVEPENNFHTQEFDRLFVKISTENDNEIDRIELFAMNDDGWYDTSYAIFIFNQKPYETSIIIPEICVESDILTLFAVAYLTNGEALKSENTFGFIVKDLPPDNSLIKYDYKGFDLDSNLVIEGILTLEMRDTIYNHIEIKGRRNLVPIVEELAYEKGSGFTAGYINTFENSYLDLTECETINYPGGVYHLTLYGSFSDTLFYGERRLSSFDPTVIIVGTFTAQKR